MSAPPCQEPEGHDSWLQAKVAAQRDALDALNRRVVRQRFQLRIVNQLGRGLSTEEFLKHRDAEPDAMVRERIGDPG